jgi:hypothetical protein
MAKGGFSRVSNASLPILEGMQAILRRPPQEQPLTSFLSMFVVK